MQNDALYNKIMNKVLLFTLKYDSDADTLILENASMNPSQLMTLKPPFFPMLYIHDADDALYGYGIGITFDVVESNITIGFDWGAIIGDLSTDTWALAE